MGRAVSRSIVIQLNPSRRFLALIYSPIIFFHELGHALFALVFLQKIRSFSFGDEDEKGAISGSVSFTPTDSLSASFVALGPLILVMSLLGIGEMYIYPKLVGIGKFFYFLSTLFLAQASLLSKKDWLVGLKGLFLSVLILSFAILVASTGERKVIFDFLTDFNAFIQTILWQLCIINSLVWLVLKVLHHVTIFSPRPKD